MLRMSFKSVDYFISSLSSHSCVFYLLFPNFVINEQTLIILFILSSYVRLDELRFFQKVTTATSNIYYYHV